MTGDLKNEAVLKVAGGQQCLNGSSVMHFLRFLMNLVSQWVQNLFHLVGVVHPGWWTVKEGGGLQQVEGLLKHFVLQQQQRAEEKEQQKQQQQQVQGAEPVLEEQGWVR